MKTIDRTINERKQDVVYQEILSCSGEKLRVHIKSDSYDFQSHARVDVLSPERQWLELYCIYPSGMNTPHGLSHRKTQSLDDFSEDRDRLLDVAKKILGIVE